MVSQDPEQRIAELEEELAQTKHIAELERELAAARAAEQGGEGLRLNGSGRMRSRPPRPPIPGSRTRPAGCP